MANVLAPPSQNALYRDDPRAYGLPVQNRYGQFDVGGPLKGNEGRLDMAYEIMPFVGDARALSRAQEAAQPTVTPDLMGGVDVGIEDPYTAAFETATALPAVGDVGTLLKMGAASLPGIIAMMARRNQALGEIAQNAPRYARETGVIGSTGAKTADLGLLAKAEDMKAAGANADDIYSETKWWLDHPDGRPRFEIDDSLASMGDVRTLPEGPLGSMGMNLKHDEMYKAYPDTKRIQLFGNNGYGGEYRKASDEVTASNKEVVLHELQHAIQGREGMARGGSPEHSPLIFTHPAQRNHYEDLVTKYEETLVKRDALLNEHPYGDLRGVSKNELELYDRLIESIPKEIDQMERGAKVTQYKKLAGETEARLVESRMGMSMGERLANPFYNNYDIPLRRQVIDKVGE